MDNTGNGYLDDSIGRAISGEPEHIKGLVCAVTNCAYHDSDGYCTAKRVNIGPGFASSCTDTVCATFKQAQMSKS